jgi:hypothetical protein
MKSRSALLTSLIIGAWLALAFLARLAPHPANLSPFTAMTVFCGAVSVQVLGRKAWLGWVATFAALFLSDVFLGFYASALFVYLGFASALALGFVFRRDVASSNRIHFAVSALTATVAGAMAFFAISNLGVWLEGTLYPLTAAGFASCYFAAIPFLLRSLSGDLFWAVVLFGAWAYVRSSVSMRAVAASGVKNNG